MKIVEWLNKHPIIYWVPLFILIIIIAFFSLLPRPFDTVGVGEDTMERLTSLDTLHFLAYLAFGFLAGVALRHSKIKHHYLTAIALGYIFGGAMELLQIFIPGRYSSIIDSLINLEGIVLAQGIRWILKKIRSFDEIF